MAVSLAHKSVLILGGFGGIGVGIARHFLPRGLQKLGVIDNSRNTNNSPLEDVEKKLKFVYKQAEVQDEKLLRLAMFEIAKELNGLDIIINSAGIFNEQQPGKMIAVNYEGVVNSTFTGIDLLRRDKGGRGGVIINIASETGIRPNFTIPIYSGTKHAIVGFTRALSDKSFHERTGVTFLTICPGATDTQMIRAHKGLYALPESWDAVRTLTKSIVIQPTSVVGECIEKALSDGENGSVWSCIGNKIQKVAVPTYENL